MFGILQGKEYLILDNAGDILCICILVKFNFVIKVLNWVTKAKGHGHIQTFFDIPTLRQKHDATSNVGFSVA